ncbi:hypothetical protein SAMN04487934_101225 [Eubacterium ruminantium]|nr:hypothetical protein SAMN04487934_101225 [Eubacterium ruminantium]
MQLLLLVMLNISEYKNKTIIKAVFVYIWLVYGLIINSSRRIYR